MLRKLEKKDAPLMLEWMHDPSVVENLNRNFGNMTIEDCERFIESSAKDEVKNLHLAITDDNDDDEYLGTVSLKNIDKNAAEFAITIRTSAMGRGISRDAMKEIIRIGYEVLGLDIIYWYVSEKNLRAVKFYDKNGYKRISVSELEARGIKLEDSERQRADLIWYKA